MKNIFIGLCVCFLFGSEYVRGFTNPLAALGIGGIGGTSPLEKFNLPDLASSSGHTAVGIISQVPSLVNPETFFSFGKNAIAGYPVEAAFKAINMFCKYFILIYRHRQTFSLVGIYSKRN